MEKTKNKEKNTGVKDINRFFFPNEWISFLKEIDKPKIKNKLLYELQFQTGARFNEVLHLRPIDFDFERSNVRLWKTKTKAKKGEKIGKPRTISLSTDFSRKMKRFCNGKERDAYLFKVTQAGYNQLLKNKIKKLGIKDYYNFSSHNIRKTHGMYLKALGIDIAEICTRLGHDYNTYIQHYGSADIFFRKGYEIY